VPVNLICPNLMCRKPLQVDDQMRGQNVRCPHCQQMLTVPAAKPAPPRPQSTQS